MAHGGIHYGDTCKSDPCRFISKGFGFKIVSETKSDKKGRKTGEKHVFQFIHRGFVVDMDTGGDSRIWIDKILHSGTVLDMEFVRDLENFIQTRRSGIFETPSGFGIEFTSTTLKIVSDEGEELVFHKTNFLPELD